MARQNPYSHYGAAQPRRPAAGGTAVSRRGPVGSTWWSQRFTTVLENLGQGTRMTRGRAYARSGQVIDLSIRPGEVAASVQGTRSKPYSVLLQIDVYHPDQWSRVEHALVNSPVFAAELLDGQMPLQIDEVFARCGLTLFPVRREFKTDCTCPDWDNPCKHIAAACYVLADHFDKDPFAMLAWRGRDRATLLHRVEALRDGAAWEQSRREDDGPALGDLTKAYWTCPAPLPESAFAHAPGPGPGPRPGAVTDAGTGTGEDRDRGHRRPGAVLDRLGPVGVEVAGEDVRDLLVPVYRALADWDGGLT